MTRATNAVAARKRTKRLLKQCKGFYGDRKNHHRLSKDALMSALSFQTRHRKLRKREMKSLWITRIGAASKIHGLSYSKFIDGLKRAECLLDRKSLAELAVRDMESFGSVVNVAKTALAK